MKNKIKVIAAAVGIAAISMPNIYAASTINYTFNYGQEYRIMLDGDTYTVPNEVTYSDNTTKDTARFKQYLQTLANSANGLISYENNKLTFNGGVSRANITNETIPLVNLNTGVYKTTVSTNDLKNYFEYYILKNKRQTQYEDYTKKLETATEDIEKFECMVKISDFAQDVERMSKIVAPATNTTLYGCVPYLHESYGITDTIPQGTESVVSSIPVNYYLDAIILRDMRLAKIEYSINSGNYVTVPKFDADNYTYTVKLPQNVPDDATIKTKASGIMELTMKNNNMPGYENMGLTITNADIKLKNGMATAKVKVTFDVSKYPDSATYKTNPVREYTIVFNKNDFLKGDLDRNGVVNSNDAAMALDLYNNNSATDEDIKIGDMDNDGVINSNDAAAILDVYNAGN